MEKRGISGGGATWHHSMTKAICHSISTHPPVVSLTAPLSYHTHPDQQLLSIRKDPGHEEGFPVHLDDH